MEIYWEFKSFDALTNLELYRITNLREVVFVVEQDCVYLDADGRDLEAIHFMGKDKEGNLAAYARYFEADKNGRLSFGRVVVAPAFRSKGLGQELMRILMRKLKAEYTQNTVVISAQKYLVKFYESFGFGVEGEPYLEDNIPHIKMICRL